MWSGQYCRHGTHHHGHIDHAPPGAFGICISSTTRCCRGVQGLAGIGYQGVAGFGTQGYQGIGEDGVQGTSGLQVWTTQFSPFAVYYLRRMLKHTRTCTYTHTCILGTGWTRRGRARGPRYRGVWFLHVYLDGFYAPYHNHKHKHTCPTL